MKRNAAVLMTAPVIVLTAGLATAAVWAESRAWEPEKGAVVFVSRVLQSDSGQSRASKKGGNPADTGLPACEPVEVRAVHGKSLKVLWRKDGKTESTLAEHWDAVVHATKTDCLKVVEKRSRKIR